MWAVNEIKTNKHYMATTKHTYGLDSACEGLLTVDSYSRGQTSGCVLIHNLNLRGRPGLLSGKK